MLLHKITHNAALHGNLETASNDVSLSLIRFESCEGDWLRRNCHGWSPVLGLLCLQKKYLNPQQCYDTHPPDDILAKWHSSKSRGRHSLDARNLCLCQFQWSNDWSSCPTLASFSEASICTNWSGLQLSTIVPRGEETRNAEKGAFCDITTLLSESKLKLVSYSYDCYHQISLW